LHHEIDELLKAALRWQRVHNDKNLHRLIGLLEKLSSQAREWLQGRAARIASVAAHSPSEASPQTFTGRNGEILSRKRPRPRAIALPVPDDLWDETNRFIACEDIVALCVLEGRLVNGKRKIAPFAPKLSENPRKREAEENFVDALRSAWLEATGKPASWTANPYSAGPFARMAGKCLMLLTTGKVAKLEPHRVMKFEQMASRRITAIDKRRREAETKVKFQRKRWVFAGVPHGLEGDTLGDPAGAGFATVVSETAVVGGRKKKRVATIETRTMYLRNWTKRLIIVDTDGL
jgi:hypothetical protein